MKIYIKKNLLLRGLQITEKGVGKNLTLPILSNVLLKTNGNKLSIISTDLETALTATVSVKTEQEGEIAVNPRVLTGFLLNAKKSDLEVEVDKNVLYITQEGYKTSFKGEGTKDFPVLPKVNKDKFFTVDSNTLTKSLAQVVNSVGSSETKPELTGVFFNLNKNENTLAATDSFRLSEKKLDLSDGDTSSVEEKFIIPAKAVHEIIRSYEEVDDVLNVYIDDKQVMIENSKASEMKLNIISKLIEGDYPDYKRIIPQTHSTKVVVSKKELLQKVKTAGLFASKINDVKLKISKNKLSVHSQDYDVGEFNDYIDASIEGEEKEITFNYIYLLEGLNNTRGDEIALKMNQPDTPVLIESTEEKDYLYVLMPIRS